MILGNCARLCVHSPSVFVAVRSDSHSFRYDFDSYSHTIPTLNPYEKAFKQEYKAYKTYSVHNNFGSARFLMVRWRTNAQNREETHKPKHKTITKTENGCFFGSKEHGSARREDTWSESCKPFDTFLMLYIAWKRMNFWCCRLPSSCPLVLVPSHNCHLASTFLLKTCHQHSDTLAIYRAMCNIYMPYMYSYVFTFSSLILVFMCLFF